MEPFLKPRDKVTQHMTRDGLTLDNQTTGESVNVSSREAEQEYTTQPEGRGGKNTGTGGRTARPPQGKESGQGRPGETVAQATSSNQTRPAAPYRKPGFTSTEKSMR